MDLNTLIKLIPTLITAGNMISQLVSKATSNEDLIAKVGQTFPILANVLQLVGEKLFPAVNPQLQQAAAIVRLYGAEFVKTAQFLLNTVSPLLGLPNPNLEVDGVAGILTQAATKAVQEKLKATFPDLVVDGFFGFKTLDAVRNFLAGLAPKA